MSKQWCVCVCGFHFLSFKLKLFFFNFNIVHFPYVTGVLIIVQSQFEKCLWQPRQDLFSVKVIRKSYFVESLNKVAETDDMVHLIG